MSKESVVQSIRTGGKITKEVLYELGADPNLEGYLICCKWKGGSYSVGWSDMNDLDLAYSLTQMDDAVKKNLFGARINHE